MTTMGQEAAVSYHSTLQQGADSGVCIIDFVKKSDLELIYREQMIISRVDNSIDVVPPLVPDTAAMFMEYSGQLSSQVLRQELMAFYVPSCIATSINLECPTSGTFARYALAIKTNPVAKKVLLG